MELPKPALLRPLIAKHRKVVEEPLRVPRLEETLLYNGAYEASGALGTHYQRLRRRVLMPTTVFDHVHLLLYDIGIVADGVKDFDLLKYGCADLLVPKS